MGVGRIKEEERDKKKTVSEEGIMAINSRNGDLMAQRGSSYHWHPAQQGQVRRKGKAHCFPGTQGEGWGGKGRGREEDGRGTLRSLD